MLEFHLRVSKLPGVLAILTMEVKVAVSQKSPLVNPAKLLCNEETSETNLGLTLMASEFAKNILICPKIRFLRALCGNGSLLQWHSDLGLQLREFAKGQEQLIENFLSGP